MINHGISEWMIQQEPLYVQPGLSSVPEVPRTWTMKEGDRFSSLEKSQGTRTISLNMDLINPEYFKYIDRKINYLNENGIIPFIEVSRRDAGLCWFQYYGSDSYVRFIQYVFSRYHANNTVLSPIHLDIIDETVSPDDYSAAVEKVKKIIRSPTLWYLAVLQCESIHT